MRTVVVVQARMGSSRLPGKVLLPVGGRPLLSYQIERLRRVTRVDEIVVAIPVGARDDELELFCVQENLRCVRGPEQDVLARYALAAEAVDAQVIVRVTSDCPLIDPDLVDRAISAFLEPPACDYLSNMLKPSWPYGMAVEVMTRSALQQAHAQAQDPREREHVTPFIYWRPERFALRSLESDVDLSAQRWTVDTAEDFELVSRLLLALYPAKPRFDTQDVLTVLSEHPSWCDINRHVMQKTLAGPTA